MSNAVAVIFSSGFKAACEVLLAIGVSGVLEAVFPPQRADASPWMNLLEGTLEMVTYLLIIGVASESLGDLIAQFGLARVPYGALLMPWLLEGALGKITSFVQYMIERLNKRRASFMPTPAVGADPDSDDEDDS